MDEQLLNALLDDYGEYYGSIVRLNLGSYASTSDIDPEFKATEDKRGIKFVDLDQLDESKVLAACIDGFKKALEGEDAYKDFDLSQITVENLGNRLARMETVGYAVYCYETWLNEGNYHGKKVK
jgi:hypothetical protein